MIDTETLKELARMYDEGASNRDMAAVTGIKASYVAIVFAYAIECGYTKPRDEYMEDILETKKKIRKLLNEGKTRHEVAVELSLAPSTVSRYVSGLLYEGTVKRINKTRTLKSGNHIVVPSTLAPGETIKCDAHVSRSCVYGTLTPNDGLCRYVFITGHCRSLGPDGCDYKACTKYSKVSRTNPRIQIKEG